MSTQWIKETTELIGDLEKKLEDIEVRFQELANERENLITQIGVSQELIKLYMNKHNVSSVTPEDFKIRGNKSYPEMLIEIAKNSNGILNVSDTVELLLKAKVGTDKTAIQHNVYNAISRGHFAKIARGQYRFTNHVETKTRRKQAYIRKERSGVREAVKALKARYPQMTLKDVREQLIETHFDFKGRKPIQSVNMAWVSLGYSKEGKQQPMPLNPVIEIEVPEELRAKIMPTSKN